ncbi:MAG: preprotein translocase subunit SecG [Alphaproteobacteria bacterium]|nr:preprotein translocase subunit SecG [Alphaproteobacteria bacterium]
MITILLVIHVLLCVALIVVVLLQRSEGGLGGLGGGSGGGGMSGFMTGRSAANVMTRTTAVLAALFMATSLILAVLYGQERRSSIVDIEPEPEASESAPEPESGRPQVPVAD